MLAAGLPLLMNSVILQPQDSDTTSAGTNNSSVWIGHCCFHVMLCCHQCRFCLAAFSCIFPGSNSHARCKFIGSCPGLSSQECQFDQPLYMSGFVATDLKISLDAASFQMIHVKCILHVWSLKVILKGWPDHGRVTTQLGCPMWLARKCNQRMLLECHSG